MTRVAACLLVLAALVSAQQPPSRITAVQFEPPPASLTEAELLSLTALSAGELAEPSGIRQALGRLYETGLFDDIVIESTPESGGVRLIFRLTPRWFVGQQRITEAKEPPSAPQLLNSGKLSLGREYSDIALRQAVENMRGLLRANGLYGARVEPLIIRRAETNQVDLRFEISAERRARFGEPVVSGQTQLTPSRIGRATGWQRFWGLGGYRAVTESRVENGIQRIRRMLERKNFLMSSVTLRGLDYDPETNIAKPAIEVNDGPPVDIRVEGTRLSRGRIRTLIPVYQEQAVDRELLNAGSRSIARYLQSQGYFEAGVDFSEGVENGRRTVRYVVERGQRYKLTGIDITGNQYFGKDTILERMNVTPASFLRYRNGRFSERLLELDENAILSLYRSNGFLNATVSSQVDTGAAGREQRQRLHLDIREGPQYLVGRVEFTGLPETSAEAVRGLMQSIEGQPFSDTAMNSDRETVLSAYFNEGYTEATFDWTAEPGDTSNTVVVKVNIGEGRQRFVRRVVVSGLETSDPQLVSNRISLESGGPLSIGRLQESQKALYDLGIFARVDAAIQNPDGIEDRKLVVIDVEEAKKYSFNAGFGAQIGRIGGGSIQSFESPGGATGFSPRLNLGITRINFLGQGHQLGLQGRISNIQQRLQATYVAPHFRDREPLSLAASVLYDESQDVRTFSATRLEAAIQLSEAVSKAVTIQGRLVVRRVEVDEDTLKIQPQLIPRLAQPVRLGIVAATFIQDRRDDPIDTRRGIYNSVDAGIATKYLGSQSDFLRLLARNSTYHRVTRDLIFARTLTFGVEERLTGGPLNDVPLPERFFAGGSASHRGFPENQAGPRDLTTGFPIGGKALMIFGHELRYPLIGDNLGGVFFHDMGNVYSEIGDVSFRYRQRGLADFDYAVQTLGVGIRYRTPIGPIRVDVAYSPNSPRFLGFEGTREELLFGQGRRTLQRLSQLNFHFSLGQTF